MLRRLAAGLALALLAPAGVGAAELRLDWAGGGTDKDPGAWTIRLTGVAPDAEGRWAVDDGSSYPYGAGEAMLLEACGPAWRREYPKQLALGPLFEAASRHCRR